MGVAPSHAQVTLAQAPDAKLDKDIPKDAAAIAIFVRMDKQLLLKAGDYEAYARKHDTDDRLVLRKQVIEALKANTDASWKKVGPRIEALQKAGKLRGLMRYWIVNGFACATTGQVCHELAALPSVSFVYRQRLQVPLHKRQVAPTPAAAEQRFTQLYKQVLSQWKDDSNAPLVTEGFQIAWNVKGIKADQAWKQGATGKGVTIALCDTGLMITPSLTAALWRNLDEKLNGKDDDGNGYIDDIFGYDFSRDHFYALGDGAMMTHGSMCGGIMAGRPLNKQKLITGIAPRAKLMVLRGMGVLKAYEYALEKGADIMSMSYMWPGRELGNYRGLYRLAHEHLAIGGVLSVGGAGNFGKGSRRAQPAGKQIALPKDIPCVIAASGILRNGNKAPASSEGPCYWSDVKFYSDYPKNKPLNKPDVTGYFGGYPVWGRPSAVQRTNGQWKLLSDEGGNIGLVIGPQGNSFSGPHAAGVAALMLSANPGLPVWKVKALIEATCTDIGAKGRDTVHGAGLLNALEAVKAAKKN
jgi:hypothetical protein